MDDLTEKLEQGKASVEEGMKLYHSYVEQGAHFPINLEAKLLEICIRSDPNRSDLLSRYRNVLAVLEQPWPEGMPSGENNIQCSEVHADKEDLVIKAMDRMERVCSQTLSANQPEHGTRWGGYASFIKDRISQLHTCKEVLHVAQSEIGFEHRQDVSHEGKYTSLYEGELRSAFPQFASILNKLADHPDSVPRTVYMHQGRAVSNTLFYYAYLLFDIMSLLSKPPETIVELGGGYGALARIFFENPIHSPTHYVLVDMPEALFFAETILKKWFGEDQVCYLEESITNLQLNKDCKIYLIPIVHIRSLESLEIDLLINTGSMQEMSEEWINYYGEIMDSLNLEWFYSLNYFAQPLKQMREGANYLSPKLSSAWITHDLQWNPAFIRMQSIRNFARGFYRKEKLQLLPLEREQFDRDLRLPPTGARFLKIMDQLRLKPEPESLFATLGFAMRMPFRPKEAMWLAERLLAYPDLEQRKMVEVWHAELRLDEAEGVREIR